MKVLVLGHNGMLGHMVRRYLESRGITIEVCKDRWPINQTQILEFDGDYIINCIGAIPQKTITFSINYELPIWLDKNTNCKIIHPGTDHDVEDPYGLSKRKATDYILKNGIQTKIIKTSIIGTELQGNASLLEWFLSQDNEVHGYTSAMWNGNTTLEWSKHCYDLMMDWKSFNTETTLEGESISKYELLNVIAKVWNKDIKINKIDKGADRRLTGDIKTPGIEQQLQELKDFTL